MGRKKLKETKLGLFLRAKAPHILNIVGDVLPNKGVLGILKNIIDKDDVLDSETKILIKTEVQSEIYNQVFNNTDNMKSIFTSKKFYYAVAGVISIIIAAKSGLPEEVITETIVSIAVVITALITGQGLADFGKEKEKLK